LRIEEKQGDVRMHRLLIAVERLIRDDRGQDLLEYGLLVALIAVAATVAVGVLGTSVNTVLWMPIVNAL
jgi:Flp pilus assembly pilin Flp